MKGRELSLLLAKFFIQLYKGDKMNEIDVKLLKAYCEKLYGQEQADEMFEAYADNLFGENGLAHLIGRDSLPFFCLYFLQDIFRYSEDNNVRKLDDFHFEIWDTLQKMFIDNEFDKLELLMPRGSSKTTTCDIALSCWLHCYAKSVYTMVLGKTEQDAQQFISAIKYQLQNNSKIIEIFGLLIDKTDTTKRVNSLELELSNNTKIQAMGSGTSIRGKTFTSNGQNVRPSCIIADDYQGLADIVSTEARDKKYKTWIADVEKCGDKAIMAHHARQKKVIKMATKFIVLGTLLHPDCLMSRLKGNPTYKHIEKKAILIDDIDHYFDSGLWGDFRRIYFDRKNPNSIEDAKAFYSEHFNEMQYPVLWNDKYDCLDLAIDYYADPSSFKQEYQNDVKAVGALAFHHIHTFNSLELAVEKSQNNIVKTVLCVDSAVATGQQNDYTALAVASKDKKGFKWIEKGIIDKYPYGAYINMVISLIREYPDISTVWIEKNTYNGADVIDIKKLINEDKDLKSRRIHFINDYQYKNKENKIYSISSKVDNGFISFNEDDVEFIEQIKAYCGKKYSAHDDAPDIVAEADRILDLKTQGRIKIFNSKEFGLWI